MQLKSTLLAAIIVLVTLAPAEVAGQCAMCKTAVESSLESGSSAAAGINKGVLYMFLTPYVIAATIGFFWWRAKKRAEQAL